jgi:hypothetical protein
MTARAKAIVPLAIVIGVLAFGWTEVALNFQFHWVTNGTLGKTGLALPAHFQLIVWIGFIAWGLFFAAGADNAAAGKIAIASIFGALGFLATAGIAPHLASTPKFWSISLLVGVCALILVLILIIGDWYYVAGTFPIFGALFGLWVSTGIDNWWPGGAGSSSGLSRLAAPGSPGTGAFGGVLSLPWYWVFIDGLVSAIAGVILGIISAKVAAAVTPKPASAAA